MRVIILAFLLLAVAFAAADSKAAAGSGAGAQKANAGSDSGAAASEQLLSQLQRQEEAHRMISQELLRSSDKVLAAVNDGSKGYSDKLAAVHSALVEQRTDLIKKLDEQAKQQQTLHATLEQLTAQLKTLGAKQSDKTAESAAEKASAAAVSDAKLAQLEKQLGNVQEVLVNVLKEHKAATKTLEGQSALLSSLAKGQNTTWSQWVASQLHCASTFVMETALPSTRAWANQAWAAAVRAVHEGTQFVSNNSGDIKPRLIELSQTVQTHAKSNTLAMFDNLLKRYTQWGVPAPYNDYAARASLVVFLFLALNLLYVVLGRVVYYTFCCCLCRRRAAHDSVHAEDVEGPMTDDAADVPAEEQDPAQNAKKKKKHARNSSRN